VKPVHGRAEPLEVALSAGRGQGCEAAAMERAVAADHPVALGVAGLAMVFARVLYLQRDRLGVRIVEEHGIGKAVGGEPLRKTLLPRDLEQVRAVPQLLGLLGYCLDQMRMAMAERGNGDAAREIEKFAAVGGVEVAAFATIDADIPPAIGRHNSWNHGNSPVR